MKRRKLFFWLKRNIFKVPEACKMPKLLRIIWYILFPLDGFYANQSHIKYDVFCNRYIIYGVEYSAEFFAMFANNKAEGIFRVTKDNIVTKIETI